MTLYGADSRKVSLLYGVKENEQLDLICSGITLKPSSHQRILVVIIGNEFSFDEHIINICKTANNKLTALSRINHYIKQNQKEILLPSFIISHSSYCPLIWSFYSKKSTKNKYCSWKIFTDYAEWLGVSLPVIIRESTPNDISPTMYTFSYDQSLWEPELKFTWHYEWYFEFERKCVQSPKFSHLPDRKLSFIEIRSRCYSILC